MYQITISWYFLREGLIIPRYFIPQGVDCEIDIDECLAMPCVHGACADAVNSYTCTCDDGYEGTDCEIEIDECEVYQPCERGTCVDEVSNGDSIR